MQHHLKYPRAPLYLMPAHLGSPLITWGTRAAAVWTWSGPVGIRGHIQNSTSHLSRWVTLLRFYFINVTLTGARFQEHKLLTQTPWWWVQLRQVECMQSRNSCGTTATRIPLHGSCCLVDFHHTFKASCPWCIFSWRLTPPYISHEVLQIHLKRIAMIAPVWKAGLRRDAWVSGLPCLLLEWAKLT